MSQLFTLQFPKYHFEKRKQFSITFPNVDDLPFRCSITMGIVRERDK